MDGGSLTLRICTTTVALSVSLLPPVASPASVTCTVSEYTGCVSKSIAGLRTVRAPSLSMANTLFSSPAVILYTMSRSSGSVATTVPTAWPRTSSSASVMVASTTVGRSFTSRMSMVMDAVSLRWLWPESTTSTTSVYWGVSS